MKDNSMQFGISVIVEYRKYIFFDKFMNYLQRLGKVHTSNIRVLEFSKDKLFAAHDFSKRKLK